MSEGDGWTPLGALTAAAVGVYGPKLAGLSTDELADRLLGLDAELDDWAAWAMPDLPADERREWARETVRALARHAVRARVLAEAGTA